MVLPGPEAARIPRADLSLPGPDLFAGGRGPHWSCLAMQHRAMGTQGLLGERLSLGSHAGMGMVGVTWLLLDFGAGPRVAA